MIFVNTDLDTALKPQSHESEISLDKEVESYWKQVQRNVGKFQRMFGQENFLVVDNSEGKNYEKETLRAYRNVRKFTDKPVTKKAQKWIDTERAAIRQQVVRRANNT